ncbi:MAG: aspartate kinase [Bacteroidales bacterium]|nr:aspartate kinase [Bacteroidales bacterium]
MEVQVFKFGGASVKDAPAIENLQQILRRYPNEHLVVVISAMGKTTNFLEKTLAAYRDGSSDWHALVDELQRQHEDVAERLVPDPGAIIDRLRHIFDSLRERLSQQPDANYDFDYDQIVSYGEMLSTTLISGYLNIAGIPNLWLDARTLVRTDATYREGVVDWKTSCRQIRAAVEEAFQQQYPMVITQGFIGGTSEQHTTTLGREGSDYSAAIMAYALDAHNVTIWKDVPGLLNADPKRFPDAVKLDKIPYEEAVELSYYGASIIHPKTLKPLQNKQIPLYVKSFYQPDSEGSIITKCPLNTTIPSFIVKDHQTLITIFPKDFSFIAVDNLSDIFAMLSQHRIRINMMQNSALSFSVCTDAEPRRVHSCIKALQGKYKVKYNEDVQLITIRHHTPEAIERVMHDRKVLLRQTSRATIQFVVLPK